MQDHLQNKDISFGPSVRKHLLQNASLVAHLEAAGAFVGKKVESGSKEKLEEESVHADAFVESSEEKLLYKDLKNNFAQYRPNGKDPQSCFLEFGAGKGKMFFAI